jgi:hypothetical protein
MVEITVVQVCRLFCIKSHRYEIDGSDCYEKRADPDALIASGADAWGRGGQKRREEEKRKRFQVTTR